MSAGGQGEFDVIVVGGGMVGASLAVALAQLPIRIAVVEAFAPQDAAQPSYDDRATAVAAASRRIFETLGVWPDVAGAATAIETVHVSDRGRFGVTRIDCGDYDLPALGHVIENRALGVALWGRMQAAANIELICPARVEALVDGAGTDIGVTAATGDGQSRTLRAQLLVAADGANSPLRDLLGIGVRIEDYGQTALIANVTPQHGHRNVAYERFTPNGPLALLPMSNGRSNLVWTLAPEMARQLLGAEADEFLASLQGEFGYRLGQFRKAGRRNAYPLRLSRAERLVGERWVLVGNAAHGLHPVAGQGFNLGLRDAAMLAETCAENLDAHADIGAAAGLRTYRDARTEDQRRVVSMTDTLIKVFTSRSAPLRTARGIGLTLLELIGPARQALADRSMGLSGRQSKLARGVSLR